MESSQLNWMNPFAEFDVCERMLEQAANGFIEFSCDDSFLESRRIGDSGLQPGNACMVSREPLCQFPCLILPGGIFKHMQRKQEFAAVWNVQIRIGTVIPQGLDVLPSNPGCIGRFDLLVPHRVDAR